MKTLITKEIAQEIKESIKSFELSIKKEMSFSEDLRKLDRIEKYEEKVKELKKGLTQGWI